MSTTIDLGKLRFNWVGEWASNTQYESNDLVRYGGDVFVYIYGLKTSGNLTTNTTYWALVQEGLSWKGEYAAATAYKAHEVVHHANNAYVCILSEPAAGNAPPLATYWQLLATGVKFEGEYNNSTVYQVDDIVYYGANTYICVQNSAGGNLPTNATYWNTFSHGIQWEGVYNNSSSYQKDDVVTYGANVYISKMDNVGQLPTDTAKWDVLTSGIKYTAAWDTSKADYKINDVATHGGNAYIATADNPTQGSDPSVNTAHWDVLSSGIDWMGDWAIGTAYQKDDVVGYGGNTYIARITNTGDNPATVTASWERMTSGIEWIGVWDVAVNYEKDDLVSYGATTYIALVTNVGDNPGTVTASWQELASGVQFLGDWVIGTAYVKGDIVTYGGSSYVALANTTGDNPVTVTAKWQPFAVGLEFIGVWATGTAYTKNDIVTYGGSSYIAKVDTTGDIPDTVTASWERMTGGIRHIGDWATSTSYLKDDVVTYGGQTYKTLVSHSSGVFATDLAASKWTKFSGGMDWKGNWLTATAYKINDIVNSGGSVYIAVADHTSTAFGSDSASWANFANSGTDVALTITSHGDLLYRDASGPARLAAGADGQILQSGGANADPKFLAQGTEGQLLTSAGAAADPTWADPAKVGVYSLFEDYTAPVVFKSDTKSIVKGSLAVSGTWELFGDAELFVSELTTITSNDEYLLTTASKSNHLWYDTLYISDGATITVSDTMQGIGTATVAAAGGGGGASGAAASHDHDYTVNTVVPDDNILSVGMVMTSSARNNVYSTGEWSSSGPNSTYYNSMNGSNDWLQAWNMAMADGHPTDGNGMFWVNDDGDTFHREKIYAHNRRMGHYYRDMYYYDNASTGQDYAGVTFSVVPIRNHGSATANCVVKTYRSSGSGNYGGAGIIVYTPTGGAGTYAGYTGGAWSLLHSYTSTNNNYGQTVTISVPGGETVLLLMTSAHVYHTTYRYKDSHFYYDLQDSFTEANNMKCDLRMLETLHTGRSPTATNSTATTWELYNTCAELFGDR